MPQRRHHIYLGTIALEVNRHAAGKRPTIRPSEWADRLLLAGFDGIELWENHVLLGPPEELNALRASALPVRIFNTYVEFTDDQEPARLRVAEWVRRLGATGVKFNFGAVPHQRRQYLANIRRFAAQLPPSTKLLCECHPGTIAQAPPRQRSCWKNWVRRNLSRRSYIHGTRPPHCGNGLRTWASGSRICTCFFPLPSAVARILAEKSHSKRWPNWGLMDRSPSSSWIR